LRAPFAIGAALTKRAGRLEHAALPIPHDLRDREQLVRVGVGAGDLATVGHAVQCGARGREPERPGVDRFGDELAHLLDVRLGRRGLVERALAHRVDAHRAVAHHPARVEALRHAVDRVEVLAVGLPVPVEAFHDRIGGDVLDRLHHLRERLAVGGLARRERHATVAEDDRRDAVPARRRADRVPRELGVEVGVDVDEARRHQLAVRVELAVTAPVDGADRRDAVSVDRHVGGDGLGARAVDDLPVPDDEIVSHVFPLVRGSR
jgi:hypothetical protein